MRQADMRMRSHGLRQVVDNNCPNMLSTGLVQAVSAVLQRPDFNRLVATTVCSKLLSKMVFFKCL